jgi:predicted TIM-barrel fold metal-dependent hydrolase
MAHSYKIISGDGHLDLSSEGWVPYLPEKWRVRAPRLVTLDDGNEALLIENRPPMSPTGLVGTVQKDLPVSFSSIGNGPPAQRLQEQDEDGVDAEVLFTHPMYMRFWRGVKEDHIYRAMVHAYNRWLIEEYCSHAPERLIAMAVIPETGLEDALEELQFAKDAGFKGVCLHRFPSGKGYPTPDDDQFWAAAMEMGMPLTSHTVSGSTRFTKEGPIYQYDTAFKGSGGDRDPINIIARFAGEAATLPLQLMFAGVFDRFPDMRYYFAETQIGWLPNTLSQLDETYERHRDYAYNKWGLEPLAQPPSVYMRERCLWGFIKDPLGVQLRDTIGVENMIWGSDFAHGQGYWPHSMKAVDESMVGVPEEERHAMLAGNVVKYFKLDAA